MTTLERQDLEITFAHPLRLRSGTHTSRVAAHHNQPLGHTASLRSGVAWEHDRLLPRHLGVLRSLAAVAGAELTMT
jgi:hypothetical protein